MFAGECYKEWEKAEELVSGALKLSLGTLEGNFASNFASTINIRLYYAKLLIHKGEWSKAQDLLLDNIKDSQIELCLRRSKNPSSNSNPKVIKCVILE